jgi:hypothetical protein
MGAGGGGLEEWAGRSGRRRPGGGPARGCLRFAFYGRVSTEDWQDPASSLVRQREQAGALVRGHGTIVAEFFDIGESRSVAWARRPQAAALVTQLADPDRGWGAVVIGEYERAFYGNQYGLMAPLFEHHGVQLWLPEAGRRVDFSCEHNPRYTGRQVWNRQPTDLQLADPADISLGHRPVQRWNLPDGWVISARPAHPALVSEADFISAQDIRAACGPVPRDNRTARRYVLAGLLTCGTCGRRMEPVWSNGKAAYRCRHGHTSASAPDPGRPKNAYLREDQALEHLPALHLLLTQAGALDPATTAHPPRR